jgi:nicotinate-nucleotide adenylyltransferase
MPAKRIGVMGGMFDPIHTGHVAIALRAIECLHLDHVRLVPCHIPNHRDAANVSARDRLAMLQLVADEYPNLVVDDRECLRNEVSYTLDTLVSMREQFPSDKLVLILGWDSFCSLPSWHRWQKLFDLAHVAVLRRGGDNSIVSPALQAELSAREMTGSRALDSSEWSQIVLLDGVCSSASSTQVRQRIQAGEPTRDLLNTKVADFIRQNNLYASSARA